MKAIFAASPEPTRGRDLLARRPATEVMSSPVDFVSEELPLDGALRVMNLSRHRHLVVVDGAGRCVGVLADRAIAAAWAHDPASLSHQTVRSVLPAAPAVVAHGARVIDVARLMRTAGTDGVAVVDDDGVAVGIVTGSDLVGLLAR